MSRTTVTGMRGMPLPNLEAHGLAKKMKPAKVLIDEQARLRERATELGRARQHLEAEIKRLERDHTAAWGRAMRAGDEAPSDDGIEGLKKRLEAIRKESSAVRHAGDLADGELRQTVAEHAPEWDRLVQQRGEQILAEAQELADALSRKLSETDHLVGVHTWLQSGGQVYTPASPTAVGIEHVLHERRQAFGLVDVGVVG